MKHQWAKCLVCGTPYSEETEPYLCDRCRNNGMAAEMIKRLVTENDNAAADLAKLQEAVSAAREALREADQYVRSRMVRSGIVNSSAARMHEKIAAAISKLGE